MWLSVCLSACLCLSLSVFICCSSQAWLLALLPWVPRSLIPRWRRREALPLWCLSRPEGGFGASSRKPCKPSTTEVAEVFGGGRSSACCSQKKRRAGNKVAKQPASKKAQEKDKAEEKQLPTGLRPVKQIYTCRAKSKSYLSYKLSSKKKKLLVQVQHSMPSGRRSTRPSRTWQRRSLPSPLMS